MKKKPILYNTFGKVIKLIRESRGMTQIELAQNADLSERYIIDIENGKRNPTIDVTYSLASALGTLPSVIWEEVKTRAMDG
ncbi:helix-turn-helix domain-containing protein [Alkalihalobacterium alkalinitrilicum]|uniref:helix-turn-helix domain-containing protein n=1 Tax=Alkalihalobacterium alkalinitrilicum TaxID=427920 RepID=UPI000994DBAE|nr:helix-turn-helix transcriptional regulator [Alkalihalobacterium alkalinitrilicum]